MKHSLCLSLASGLIAFVPTMAMAQSSGTYEQPYSGAQAAQTSGGTYDTFEGPHEGTQEITLNGTGATSNDFNSGNFGITGTYGWYLNDAMLFSVRQSLNWADTDNSDSEFNGSTRVAADWHVITTGRLRPFIGANVGYVYGDGVDDSWVAGPEVGLKYFVNDTTFLLAQSEYRFNLEGDFDDGSFVNTIGLGFTF